MPVCDQANEHCSCPFAMTEDSERAQGLGCLPSAYDIIQMRVRDGKTWACHSDQTKPCIGAIAALKERGLSYKVIDPKLVTLERW